MTFSAVLTLSPLLILGAAPVLILTGLLCCRRHWRMALMTLTAQVLALLSLPLAASTGKPEVTVLLTLDHYALFYIGLIVVASLAVTLLSYGYLGQRAGHPEEYYLLLLLATAGSAVLVASSHFVSFFLGLELLSISLYTLIAYPQDWRAGVEAAVKYLILAAASSAFLLFGMALMYAQLGSMSFPMLSTKLAGATGRSDPILLAGLAMLLVGIGFKLAVVPFHMWTPDVYEGAPAPVAAFVATASKGAMFAVLLRFFGLPDLRLASAVFLGVGVVAVASMLVGNLLALLQENVKRILAYSSIAHLGYLLVTVLAGGALAVTAASFYLVAYFATSLGAFGVIAVLSAGGRDVDRLEEFRGLFWTHPWLAGLFTASLLSLAGIPLTAGFVGKFYLVAAGGAAAVWLPVFVLIATSTIGLYYYLRIIVVLYADRPETASASVPLPALSLGGVLALAFVALVIVWLGVYPSPLIRLIQAMVGAFV
ncbi:MAG TPA: NADH-quinone oxidoreductase subunit N [Gemmatimonadales bacterium]|nr:NADH-quinone oxidoreductase subunit N [Gemmatimonadales bacterium]